jgi:lipoprotein NlpD
MPVGVGSGVEVRPLDGSMTAAPPAVPAGNAIREPKGGKEPYSDEAHARLNSLAAVTPSVAASPSVAVAPENATVPASDSATTAQVDGVLWAWPSAAKIKSAYNGASNKGIDFAGKQGDPVFSAADGRVLYVGDALAGYGKLVIIKHSTDHLSVYAHNHRILVKESQPVKLGQKIAEMGSSGTDSVKLHFEIRKQGKPVDPMPFLPKR